MASTGLGHNHLNSSSHSKRSDKTEKGQTNLNISNVYNLIPIERCKFFFLVTQIENLATNNRSQAANSTNEYIKSSKPSSYASSQMHRTDTNNFDQITEGMDPKLL